MKCETLEFGRTDILERETVLQYLVNLLHLTIGVVLASLMRLMLIIRGGEIQLRGFPFHSLPNDTRFHMSGCVVSTQVLIAIGQTG